MQAIRLHFTTPLHLGGARADYDTSETVLHSDTLYAAIFYAWKKLGLDHLIPKTADDDFGFSVSSTFPFYQKSQKANTIYFLPRPMIDLYHHAPFHRHKELKKIEYVELSLYRKLFFDGDINRDLSKYIRGSFLAEKDIPGDFISKGITPRVSVPRLGEPGDAKPYYIERIFFKGRSGFYFLAFFHSEELKSAVESAIRFLQDEGLGTDRHVGNGLFEYEIEDFDLHAPDYSEYCTNLSLFCPRDENSLQEMIKNNARFDIIKRGGWITSQPYKTYRKKSIHMFREASVFNVPNDSVFDQNGVFFSGKTVDLKPELPTSMNQVDHPVWRVGKSIFIPVTI